MNRRPQGLFVQKAVEGFLQFKVAEGLSPNTIDSYERHLRYWLEYQGDLDLAKVTSSHITRYLNYLRTEYEPRRITGGNDQKLSGKTLRNYWISFSAFFSWVSAEFGFPDPMEKVPAPRFTDPPIEPFAKEEIEALLKACDLAKETCPRNRRSFTTHRATGYRDRAILFTLLDTGLRASELCALRVADVDQKTGKVLIRHGSQGKAKGGKGRIVYLGKTARKAVWRYLASREDGHDSDAPLFIGLYEHPLTRDGLRQMIHTLGEKAEVEGLTLEAVAFTRRGDWVPLPLEQIPVRVFSEVMRDLDLVVSVAHSGGVDPEASASSIEARTALIGETCALLKFRNVEVKHNHALIQGQLGNYSIHLGSAVVYKQPGGALCIVPVHAQQRGRPFLPFVDNDPKTAEVLSKVILLARDKEIKDPSILE